MRRKILLVIVILITVAFIAIWFILPQFSSLQTTTQQIQKYFGIILGPLVFLGISWKVINALAPDGTKLLSARILRSLGYLPSGLKKVVVRNEVEGNLNSAVKEFGSDGQGFIPHQASVQWISTDNITKESFLEEGKIIVRMEYSDNPHRNIVQAAILYCKTGLLPDTRRYLWPEFRRALDLAFVHTVLDTRNIREGLVYFLEEILEPDLAEDPNLSEQYERLWRLKSHGFFTRILLPELRDYATRVEIGDTAAQHKSWITEFVKYIEGITHAELIREKKVPLDHIHKRFRVSVVIVGKQRKLAFSGQKPYIKAAATCADRGARSIYLIGYSNIVRSVAKNATKLQVADSYDTQCYQVSRDQDVTKYWCSKLEVSEETAVNALSCIPDIDQWPELDIEEEPLEIEVN